MVVSDVRIILDGETYLSLASVAECYACRVEWITEVYEYGLLGNTRVVADQILISTCELDRVAEVLRLTLHYGVGLGAVALLLDPVRGWEEA